MKDKGIKGRIAMDTLFKGVVTALSFCAILPMFFILFFIAKNGIAVIDWAFLTHLPAPVGETGGGISNAIIGTAILILIASVLSVPLGICAGIYLSEYRKAHFSHYARLSVEILQGIPSIVIGIIAYVWVVVPLGTFSALSGGIALAMMMLPVIVMATDETLRLIPDSLKEAALALGASYPATILRVVLPAGLSGIVSGHGENGRPARMHELTHAIAQTYLEVGCARPLLNPPVKAVGNDERTFVTRKTSSGHSNGQN